MSRENLSRPPNDAALLHNVVNNVLSGDAPESILPTSPLLSIPLEAENCDVAIYVSDRCVPADRLYGRAFAQPCRWCVAISILTFDLEHLASEQVRR